MKKALFLVVMCIMGVVGFLQPTNRMAEAESFLPVKAKSACLIDKRTGEILYDQDGDSALPIASMVKIMTALLTFEEVEKGNLTFEEKILISENAAGMGGSQMFLDRGLAYSVSDLLKGVIVVSANDACVALAERISGSEEAFVTSMNERAKEIGMTNTIFVNATGLPKDGGHSTAKDVALMLRELTSHEDYYKYSKIWLEEYTHPDGRTTILTNTNKFIRFYDECDGGKTGFTSEAKFCLAACASRGDTKLISVVIGADDSKMRFSESKRLLGYGFANYKTEVLVKKGEAVFSCPIKKGSKNEVICYAEEDITILNPINDASFDPEILTTYYDMRAPIHVGDVLGECTLSAGDKSYTVRLISSEEVKEATIGDAYRKIAEKWA